MLCSDPIIGSDDGAADTGALPHMESSLGELSLTTGEGTSIKGAEFHSHYSCLPIIGGVIRSRRTTLYVIRFYSLH